MKSLPQYIKESNKLTDDDFRDIAHKYESTEFFGFDDEDIEYRHFEGLEKDLEHVLDDLKKAGYFGYKITNIGKDTTGNIKQIRL